MTATTPDSLPALLAGCVADRAQVRTDELSRRAVAHDASPSCSSRRPWFAPPPPPRWAR